MRSGRVAAFAALMGALAFFQVASRPRFAGIHTVDVLQLLAAGALIGIAMVAMVASLKGRKKVG